MHAVRNILESQKQVVTMRYNFRRRRCLPYQRYIKKLMEEGHTIIECIKSSRKRVLSKWTHAYQDASMLLF